VSINERLISNNGQQTRLPARIFFKNFCSFHCYGNLKVRLVSDSSIMTERKAGKRYVAATDNAYRVELVSPVLQYNEIPKPQEIVRVLRKAGAEVNTSCV